MTNLIYDTNILRNLKGISCLSNNFCLKQNGINKKFQKFICKPQLACFVC